MLQCEHKINKVGIWGCARRVELCRRTFRNLRVFWVNVNLWTTSLVIVFSVSWVKGRYNHCWSKWSVWFSFDETKWAVIDLKQLNEMLFSLHCSLTIGFNSWKSVLRCISLFLRLTGWASSDFFLWISWEYYRQAEDVKGPCNLILTFWFSFTITNAYLR